MAKEFLDPNRTGTGTPQAFTAFDGETFPGLNKCVPVKIKSVVGTVGSQATVPSPVATDLPISMSVSIVPAGDFEVFSDQACVTSTRATMIQAGTDSATVYLKSSKTGQGTLSVTAPGVGDIPPLSLWFWPQ